MRTRTFELHSIVTGIGAAAGEKLLVRATFHNATMLDGRNFIGMFNGREAMGNDDRGAAARQALKRLLHRLLAFVIQSTRRLVQDKDLGILEEHARDGDALLLAARKAAAVLAHHGVVALR